MSDTLTDCSPHTASFVISHAKKFKLALRMDSNLVQYLSPSAMNLSSSVGLRYITLIESDFFPRGFELVTFTGTHDPFPHLYSYCPMSVFLPKTTAIPESWRYNLHWCLDFWRCSRNAYRVANKKRLTKTLKCGEISKISKILGIFFLQINFFDLLVFLFYAPISSPSGSLTNFLTRISRTFVPSVTFSSL